MTIKVLYTKEMPVDQFDKPGGMLNLSDLPIKAFKHLTRPGTIDGYNNKQKSFWVTDTETNVTLKVPLEDVKLIKENEDV